MANDSLFNRLSDYARQFESLGRTQAQATQMTGQNPTANMGRRVSAIANSVAPPGPAQIQAMPQPRPMAPAPQQPIQAPAPAPLGGAVNPADYNQIRQGVQTLMRRPNVTAMLQNGVGTTPPGGQF